MKKITEITTEREFVSKLRTYYRKARRKGYQRNEISFLGLMECTGSATREFEYQSDKYFSLGIRAYDWQYGNSLLSALIDKWENEIEAEKRKKQPTQPTETPQISTEAAETVNVSAEEGNEAIKHISEIMETCRTWDDEKRDYTDEYKYYTWLANHIPEHENTNKNVTEIVLEEARERIATAATLVAHGVPKCDMEGAVCAVVNRLAKMEDILRFYDAIESSQSPEAPQIAECIANTPKPRETARKPQNRGIGSTRHSRLGANGYTMLDNASATLTAMNVPRKCSTAAYW